MEGHTRLSGANFRHMQTKLGYVDTWCYCVNEACNNCDLSRVTCIHVGAMVIGLSVGVAGGAAKMVTNSSGSYKVLKSFE